MQREMERRIRAARRELNGYNAAIQNADGLTKAEIQKDFDKAAVKLKRQEAVYKDFSYKTGISTQNDRLQTTGFGKSICQKAVWANKNAFLPLVQNANNTEGNFTKTQITKLSSAADSFLGKYCKEKSHWSGKTIVDSSVLPDGVLGCKEWNCDITLAENADAASSICFPVFKICGVKNRIDINFYKRIVIVVKCIKVKMNTCEKCGNIFPKRIEICPKCNIPLIDYSDWIEKRGNPQHLPKCPLCGSFYLNPCYGSGNPYNQHTFICLNCGYRF